MRVTGGSGCTGHRRPAGPFLQLSCESGGPGVQSLVSWVLVSWAGPPRLGSPGLLGPEGFLEEERIWAGWRELCGESSLWLSEAGEGLEGSVASDWTVEGGKAEGNGPALVGAGMPGAVVVQEVIYSSHPRTRNRCGAGPGVPLGFQHRQWGQGRFLREMGNQMPKGTRRQRGPDAQGRLITCGFPWWRGQGDCRVGRERPGGQWPGARPTGGL